jgi:hypothetical protein
VHHGLPGDIIVYVLLRHAHRLRLPPGLDNKVTKLAAHRENRAAILLGASERRPQYAPASDNDLKHLLHHVPKRRPKEVERVFHLSQPPAVGSYDPTAAEAIAVRVACRQHSKRWKGPNLSGSEDSKLNSAVDWKALLSCVEPTYFADKYSTE